ncbi:MAG TPA: SsgA family sporulation/cell division regulator [Candidatus Saccharimonadales bacterium]|nr:SsgA family sporulation/cell division regulator [Candidatus Saccharimonadales bacterium]
MGISQPTRVEAEATLRLVQSDGSTVPVRTELIYEPDDPYAVHLRFHDMGAVIDWYFGRDLALDGLEGPSGLCDVRLWPIRSTRGRFVALALSSPDGNALFHVPRSRFARFLQRSIEMVPRGEEGERLDVDTCANRLLNCRIR